eukprot:13203552-Heterocapsa_arctica.AAC.1
MQNTSCVTQPRQNCTAVAIAVMPDARTAYSQLQTKPTVPKMYNQLLFPPSHAILGWELCLETSTP